MRKVSEKKVTIQLTVEPETQRMLIELAGGPRKVGRYVDYIVRELYRMRETAEQIKHELTVRALAKVTVSTPELRVSEDDQAQR